MTAMKIKQVLPFKVPSIKQINKHKKTLKAMSFFAGCGGSSTGLKMAGFDVIYANEFVEEAANSYKANAPSTIVDCSDIRQINFKKLRKQLNLAVGELDHMDGSPPCSSFSTAGTRERDWGKVKKYSDTEQRTDDLFYEYVRAIKEFKPKTFIAENVSGLVKGAAKGYFLDILKALEDCGYVVRARLIDCSWLGVPQSRQRIIFVGVRKDLKKEPIFPEPLERQVTVAECFPYIHKIKKKTNNVVTFVNSAQPNSTITASDAETSPTAKFSDGGYVIDSTGEIRKYTIAELKVICGFPSDFKLTGTYSDQFERLGRSHVPVQVYWLAKTLREHVHDKLK